MKININPTNLSGYVNIKPEYDHMKNLDATVEDAEATEILCFEAIRRVPYTEIGNFLSHLVKKMRLNSKLVVHEIDSYEISRQYFYGELNGDALNDTIYSNELPVFSSVDMNSIASCLQELGLVIVKKRINGCFFTLEAVRNG